MKKIFLALTLLTFASPWVHRLAFENMKLAIPNVSDNMAHAVPLIIAISFALGLIVWILEGGLRK